MFRRIAVPALAIALASSNLPHSASAASGLTALQRDELSYSYRQLVTQYYKDVDAQRALDTARGHIIALLKHDGVKKPMLPALHATNNPTSDVRALTSNVNIAVTKYGSKAAASQITYAAIAGLLSSTGDRYTTFLSPKEYAELNAGLDAQAFGGVGLSIGIDDATKQLKVESVIEGGPAEKVGIQADDMVVSIDGKPTKGKSLDDDSKMLRGKPGTLVHLTILRDGKPLPLMTLTRAEIKPPSVTAKLLDGDIGYARLAVFGATTSDELGAALKKLNAQGAKAYVLDLRDNGGGYLNSAIDVSSQFISTGPIVSVAERSGSTREYDADDVATAPKPLVVLVNKYTASASEITSGAIQDDGVGTLIGTKTFGKGVVQTIFPLPDGAAVKITTARYLTPSGRDINHLGIMPNVFVAEAKDAKLGDPTNDTQLSTAISVLHQKLADNSNG
ncbi:MAG TPA: S41 family peptidase [Candidatus Baltobacteraceae bacterium]|jgi:carboxyl-terminal processing protease